MNGTALGVNASASHANSVAIGANTRTTGSNQVAMGYRQVTQVADGRVAQGSTDAVNGGQLWNLQQSLDDRALVVHSARWTERLLQQFPDGRENIERRLRHCGWGEPDLDVAIHSGSDSLTLIAQASLQPYARHATRSDIVSRDMQLHRLPWPRDVLQGLIHQDVELRVSLSYFIEPNPGERGRGDRFRYSSHGLRFAVQRPTENLVQFQARINALARDDDEAFENFEGADNSWLLGPRGCRARRCPHCG